MNALRISPRDAIWTWLGAGLAGALVMPALLATEPDDSMYIGGNVNAVAYDTDGYLYVTSGGLFVAKLDPAGLDPAACPSGVCWTRNFPSLPGDEHFASGHNIVVDDIGDPNVDGETGIYVIGQTFRSNLHWAHPNSLPPAPPPPGWDKVAGNGVQDYRDGFLLRFDFPPHQVNATLGDAVYATFIGNENIDRSDGIALDGAGMAYVLNNVGSVETTDTGMNGLHYHGGRFDMYVTVIDTLVDGDASLRFAMLLGGRDRDSADQGIALDASGTIYVAGRTESNDFRVGSTANAVYPTDGSSLDGQADAVLVVLERGEGDPPWWTYNPVHVGYLGGTRVDGASDLVLDGAGTVYLSGLAGSADFLGGFTHGVFGGGKADAFVAALQLTPCAPASDPCVWSRTDVWSVPIGGRRDEARVNIVKDTVGNVYVAGSTNSTDFPTNDGTSYQGSDDVFLAQLAPNGALSFGTLLAGSGSDRTGAEGLAIHEPVGVVQVAVAGSTSSSDFPLGPPPHENNGFVAVYEFGPDPCGDTVCGPGEDSCNCSQDCGDPVDADGDGFDECDDCDDSNPEVKPGVTEICNNGVDDNCDDLVDCDDGDCASDPACPTCGGNKAPCTVDEDCCSLHCGNDGKCKGGGTGGTLPESPFLRGDSNADGAVNLADPIHTLNYLFLSGPAPSCADAADSDDNGRVELTDPVFTLGWLYLSEGAMPPPGPEICGPDITEDALIGCAYDPVNC